MTKLQETRDRMAEEYAIKCSPMAPGLYNYTQVLAAGMAGFDAAIAHLQAGVIKELVAALEQISHYGRASSYTMPEIARETLERVRGELE
jgi:hypothetical protein